MNATAQQYAVVVSNPQNDVSANVTIEQDDAKPGQPAQNTQGQKLQGLKQSIVKSGGKRGIAEYLLASGKV